MSGSVLTLNGFQMPSQAEIVEQLQTDWRRIYGEDIELDSNTPDGQLIGILAQREADQNELIKNLFASLFPSTAEGVYLDYNLDLIGTWRKTGKPAQVNINVSFTGQRTIPAGTFSITIREVIFTNDSDIVMQGVYSFTAVETGAMQILQADKPIMNTLVAGVDLTVVSTTNSGSDSEDDTSFRDRWQRFARRREHSATYIESILMQLEGIDDCRVYEVTNVPYGGLPINCIYAVIKNGGFDKAQVLDLIYGAKPPGIRSYFTDTAEDQQKAYGAGEIIIGFDLAKYKTITNYTFNFSSKLRKTQIQDDLVLGILQQIRFGIGETVYASDVDNFVMKAQPDWFAWQGNNINGNDYLDGEIATIWSF